MSKIDETQYMRLVETMSEGVGILDRQGHLTYANPRLCQMLGYSREELCGRPVVDFFDEENLRILRRRLEQRKRGINRSYEITWTTREGRGTNFIAKPFSINELVQTVRLVLDE